MSIKAVLKTKGNSVVSVEPTASVMEIAEIIASQRIGAVMVLDPAGGVSGIVSERDVVKALAKRGAEVLGQTASDLMTRNVITATPLTTVDEAMSLMDGGYFRHLPVVEDGKLIGIVSIRDLVKYRMMLHERDVDSLKAYITRTELST